MITKDYTKEVEIGGEKIMAEFFEYEPYNDLLKSLESSDNTNVWDEITAYFHRLKHKVEDLYWKIRYGFERMFKGYDSVDTFDTFSKFIDRYQKILTEYKKTHWGYPGTMTEEEWENIIDEMLFHLYYMDEENIDKELDDGVPESWIPTLDTTNKIRESHKDKFFELFSKYFYSLWD